MTFVVHHIRFFLQFLVLTCLFCIPALSNAKDGRVALVIGNSEYESASSLPNTFNDSRDLADALERIGFDVTRGLNLSYRDMRIAIRDFAKSVPEVTFINGASAAQDATLRTPADNFFRFNPDSMQWIGGLGRYAYEERDIETIVTVSEDYSLPYTQLMGFVLDYCAAGGRLLDRHWVSPGASDTTRLAEAIARTETDGLFLAMAPRAAGKFLEAYGEAGGQAAVVASSTTLSGSLLRSADATRPLLTGAISALPVSERDDNDELEEFTARYRESFPDAGPAPGLFALAYYVNTKALLLALEETSGVLGDGHDDLREALVELSFDTPVGGPVAVGEHACVEQVDSNRATLVGQVDQADLGDQLLGHLLEDVCDQVGVRIDHDHGVPVATGSLLLELVLDQVAHQGRLAHPRAGHVGVVVAHQVGRKVDRPRESADRLADVRALPELLVRRGQRLGPGTSNLVCLVVRAGRMPERGQFAHAEHRGRAEPARG